MKLDEYRVRQREFSARGTRLPQSRLNDDLVRRIRAEHVRFSHKHGAPALARRYGVHVRTIEKVLSYETWGHVA